MALPPGFLDELRNRVSISQVVGRKVVWDQRKSNQARGDFWAPCPFHQEKSASFHVDDRKGFYHCFGCQASGDALKFLRETENMGFMEAVEVLAREAGMTMPERDPRAAERNDRRTELANVMDEAVRFFRLNLSTQRAQAARDYLQRRGLKSETVAQFELGFAPDGWQNLWDALRAKGISEDLILGAGLARPSSTGKAPYDIFRNRIMFPIRDPRGRCIGFGGRAMDPNDHAKYLNSPETELFDKGRSLYNHGPARTACGKGAPLIVCEGYMDVIALVQAGFGGAVAPLGTAVTEDQLRLMWRIHDEPVIALDGDGAGVRAAMRLVDLALPMLEAGKALRFAILPGGQDPDELIKSAGAQAMQQQISQARPMVDLLWQRETEGKVFDSPERRATLDKVLRTAISRIQDPSLRHHYGAEVNRLRQTLFGFAAPQRADHAPADTFGGARTGAGAKPWRRGGFGPKAPALPLPATRSTVLVAGDEAVPDRLRESMILAILVTHPTLAPDFEGPLEDMRFANPAHQRLAEAILGALSLPADAIRHHIESTMGADLESLMAQPHVRSAPPVLKQDDVDYARRCLSEEIAKARAARAVRDEVAEAAEELEGLADEGVTWRLSEANRARERAQRSRLDDSNDMGEDRAALSAQLQALIDGEVWRKKRD